MVPRTVHVTVARIVETNFIGLTIEPGQVTLIGQEMNHKKRKHAFD